jgi:hypothetical protein
MTHVKLTCYIGRGDNDCVGLFLAVYFSVEIAIITPLFVKATFNITGFIGFFYVFHVIIPFAHNNLEYNTTKVELCPPLF